MVAETESDGPTREAEIGLGHHRYRGPTENVRAPLSHVLVTTTWLPRHKVEEEAESLLA